MLVFTHDDATPRFFAEYQHRIDGELRRVVPGSSDRVQEAHGLRGPRPIEADQAGVDDADRGAVRRDGARAMTAACSIEMVHAASLILDDLPAMDDSRVRRGKAGDPRGLRRGDGVVGGVRAAQRRLQLARTRIRAAPRVADRCPAF